MKDALIAQIQSFTLEARTVLETEAGQQLEGIYGWLPEGGFADTARYPALNENPEATKIRRRLEAYAEEEKTAGFSTKASRGKLVRETAFTWLNRLVALRMMEERRIIKPTVIKLDKSNSFIYWLTAGENEEMYALHQKGALPQNAMGEGPSDVAYRRFMIWQCAQLARDVSVLFDPATLSSSFFPRPPVLKKIVESMNGQELTEAWQIGNEETVGWVYEGFIEEENKAVFEKFGKGKKVTADEIGAATQRFTPKWIVRFLVENSLGRLWVEMHPDSYLKDKLAYLVPTQTIERFAEPVKNISFLDPSCGSMHFGLVAFDLFVDMYKEELERAGQPGWHEQPSAASIDEIPASIIANNIYGIDIDLRSVQLSALTLFLKARTLNKECAFSDINLACSNVEAVTGGRLEEFIAQSQFSHPIYERILRAMASRMKDSDQLGSLLRLEKNLEDLIAEERKKVEARKQIDLPFPGVTAEQFHTREGVEEFFGILFEQLMRHLDGFVQNSRARGLDSGHFATEAAKGLRYIRLVSRQYDIVATNPPYMSSSNFSDIMANYLNCEYKIANSDLYAAFIMRCSELANDNGLIAMITQQSFMFISSYEDLRIFLLSILSPEVMVHLGPRAFPNIQGEKVNTTAFVFQKGSDSDSRLARKGVYFRLVKEQLPDLKKVSFENALTAMKSGKNHKLIFFYSPKEFDDIPRHSFAYWVNENEKKLFSSLPAMGTIYPIDMGLKTSDNFRFVRYFWEVGKSNVANYESTIEYRASGKKWFIYSKGDKGVGPLSRVINVVNWENDGNEIKTFLCEKYPYINGNVKWCTHNESLYFFPSITWSPVSSRGFICSYTRLGTIASNSSYAIFAHRDESIPLFGYLISKPVHYLMRILSPTINHNKGDVSLLPVPSNIENHDLLRLKTSMLIDNCNTDIETDEIYLSFIMPPFLISSLDEDRNNLLLEIDRICIDLLNLKNRELFIDEYLAAADLENSDENVDVEMSERICNEMRNKNPEFSEGKVAQSWAWISYAFGAVLGHFEIGEPEGLGRGNFKEDTALAIRALMDADGVMVSEPGHPQDITARTLRCLELMRGHDTVHDLVRKATGSEAAGSEELLRGYLDRFAGTPEVSFWRHHFQLYRKRPIFWPLQSPKRRFTVWVFQERFTKDTLFKVGSEYVDTKSRWLEARIRELKDKAGNSAGGEKRRLEKEASSMSDILDDVQEFSKRLNAIIQKGYIPHIDDGVLINAAPLWEILPSWPDTKKAWQELEEGKYDWAHQAMDHWPERVREKCKTNKSFAIAHGME